MKRIYFTTVKDGRTGENVKVLTTEGLEKLKKMETIYLPKLRPTTKGKYQYYSDYEKLETLFTKEITERYKTNKNAVKELPTTETPIVEVPTKETTPTEYTSIEALLHRPEVDLLSLDLKEIRTLKQIFSSYFEDIKAAEQLLIETELAKLKKEHSEEKAKMSDIETRIKELEDAKTAA